MLYRSQTTNVTVFAPAKLNLFLKVLGKRDDGYHELETLMLSVGLYDAVSLTDDPDGPLNLYCRDGGPRARSGQSREMPPAGADNLVLRAAELLRQAAGCARGARIVLVKRIPLAAGLA